VAGATRPRGSRIVFATELTRQPGLREPQFDYPHFLRLKEYLLKGGFLWVDDFWGSYAWDVCS
jgi:hypothetical protein